MNLSTEGFSNNKDSKFNFSNKVTSLNPNAAEFIPSAFRSPYTNTKGSDVAKLDIPGSSTKSVLDRSESNVSNKSDDEVHRFWCDQLPDDITPDFTSMGEDELHTPGQLSLASLSMNDGVETSRFLASGNSSLIGRQQDISPRDIGTFNLGENMGYLGPTFVEDQPSNGFMALAPTEWDKRFLDGAHMFTNGREEHHYDGDFNAGLMSDSLNEHTMFEDAVMNPLEFLASEFPGFAAESLADVYYANSCDLNLTVEMLTQLELQDANFSQNTNSKSSDEPNFSMLDFPALPAAENNNGMSKFNGQDLQQSSNTYRSPSSIPRGTIDFASTVRKLASQDSANRKYERSVSTTGSVGSSRSSQLSSISYNHNGKSVYGDKLRSSSTVRTAPVWLDTGEAVANMYSELRGDARDFARLRNACFEQARQAYLIGNGALAKELSRKGQLYNMQMKAAHGKARETIYRQRNPDAQDGRMQDRLIDLHGLHVNEAIQVLEHELRILRSTARSAGQRLQVMICVGTGHHTKGARTPVRLPIAVEHFLLEEGLSFTQPRPGLIRVVIY